RLVTDPWQLPRIRGSLRPETMRLAAAAAIAVSLSGCGLGSPSENGGQNPAAPAPALATMADLLPYYGSYATPAGDTLVIARMGWFFDVSSSAYRTIYLGPSPGHFTIGCLFRLALPKCAALDFTKDMLTMRDASHAVTVARRVANVAADVSIPVQGATLAGTITMPP